MDHKLYSLSDQDNMLVLLERNQFIAGEISASQIDDLLLIPSCPEMWSKIDRHDAAFRFAH